VHWSKEEAMKELGWILVGLTLGIPISYFINLSTPWVGSYIKNRSLSRRERKMKMAISRYETFKGYKENPLMMVVMLLSLVLWAVVILGVIVIFSFVFSETLYKFISVALLYLLYYITNAVSTAIENVRKFNEFEGKTLSKLLKLGYSAEVARELMGKKD
jgi:hypothetical protein